MAISFKSVGNTPEQRIAQTTQETVLPIGIKTPLRLGSDGDSLFAMHYDMRSQVRDNLRNLILTNWGERLGLWDFGGNLRELTTEFIDERFDAEAVIRIKRAVDKWMPYVGLTDFIPAIDRDAGAKIGVVVFSVTYSVPILNVENDCIEITLYVI